jgi:hypothetical protein
MAASGYLRAGPLIKLEGGMGQGQQLKHALFTTAFMICAVFPFISPSISLSLISGWL